MLSYREFLNESLLILESEVQFSDNFIKILNKIKHPLGKKIIDIHKQDLPVTNNFFDINPNDNSKVFFIQDRKAQQLLNSDKKYVRFIGGNSGWLKHSSLNQNIFDLLGYKPEGNVYAPNSTEIGEVISEYKSPKSGKTYNYVKFKNGSGVYNVEKLEKVTDISPTLFGSSKQDVSIGRAMSALMKSANIEFTNKELEDFVNEYKSIVDLYNGIFSSFEQVYGDDIKHWYHMDNYIKGGGTLSSSCMRYDHCSEYFDIYTQNPEVCSLLILKDKIRTDKIIGRALIWKLRTGYIFMDRIYTINDSDVNLFREYAKSNGWYAKYDNNSSVSDYVYNPNGQRESINLTVFLKYGEYDSYPYLDTLKYLDGNTKSLSAYRTADALTLDSTEGSYTHCDVCYGEGTIECSDCDGRGEIDCYECDGRGENDCSTCGGTGEVEGADGEHEECGECYGTGQIDCDYCLNGQRECGECYGSGQVDCHECS